MSIVFDRSRDRRQRELTNNRTRKGRFHVRNYFRDIFDFAEHQEKATYGLGYISTLTKNTDNSVLNKDNAFNNAEIKINAIEWYVPHYTPSISNQFTLAKQVLSKTPTELQYVAKSVFMKEINTQCFCIFELGTQEGINIPKSVNVSFQQKDRQHSQNSNNDTFYSHPVTATHCFIGTEKYPDHSILLKSNDDDYVQGFGEIKEASRAPTKDDILQPYISENDFRSTNNNHDIGYNFNVFDMRYQKNLESVQQLK